jgi:hypothetical protein
MSCGTWCYKKCERQYKPEEIMDLFETQVNESVKDCKEIITGTKWSGAEYKNNIDKYYPYESKEDAENTLVKLNWFVDNIKNVLNFKKNYEDDIKNKVKVFSREGELYAWFYGFSYYNEFTNAHYDEQTHTYYVSVNYGNDLFRGLDYDGPHLYSRKETLNYIKNNKDKVMDVNYDKIKEFWNKYSDGMIDFG